jgi:hypothetical protein
VTDDDSGAIGGAPPKLTLGQRILTALPNLQRQPAPIAATRQAAPTRAVRSPRPVADAHDGEGETGETEVDDEQAQSTSTELADGASSGLGGRLRDSLLKPPAAGGRSRPADDLDTMTREEITYRIKRLDDRERFLALTSAPIGVGVGVLLTVFALHLNPALKIHGKINPKHVSDSLILLEGGARLLLAGIVVAAALSRRRSFVGFALLFLGTAMGSPLFALPFWVLGGYLIWRVFKYQRVLTAKGAGARGAGARGTTPGRATSSGRVPASPRAAGRAGATAARERVQANRRRGRKEPAPTGPTPSKRYTPPRPTRPRPPAPPS